MTVVGAYPSCYHPDCHSGRSLYANEEHIEAVAALYLQHFLIDANLKNRDQFLRDMLTSKYKEWPTATNFVSARTLLLLRCLPP
jgi:hypothetical protein